MPRPEQDTSRDYAVFQDGKLTAFAEPKSYKEEGLEFDLNVTITKGTIRTGQSVMDFYRSMDVFTDGAVERITSKEGRS